MKLLGRAIVGGVLVGLLTLGLAVETHAQPAFSAQIQAALKTFVARANTWTGTQTFTNVNINGTCTGTGCGAVTGLSLPGVINVDNGTTLYTAGVLSDQTPTTGQNALRYTSFATHNQISATAVPTQSRSAITGWVESAPGNASTLSNLWFAGRFTSEHFGSGAATGAMRGVFGSSEDHGGNATTVTGGEFKGELSSDSTGNVGTLIGMIANSVINHGNVTTARGASAQLFTGGGAVTSEGSGLFVDVNIAPSTSVITYGVNVSEVISQAGTGTAYGVYVGTVDANTKYSFYANDATAPSRFLGGAYAPFHTAPASTIIASGGTIAPTGMVHHISGTAAIATITVPATCTPTCVLYLVPDGLFTTTNAGNISLASTAVVNKTLIMTWDGTKWNPSY